MATRDILLEHDEFLRQKCREVKDFNKHLWTLLDDMLETMNKANGVGLAAPQVGVIRRVAVVDVGDGSGLFELINPEIIKTSGEEIDLEGCLSIPEKQGYVKRPKSVTVKALNRFGEEYTVTGEDFLARAFCHEIDHLDGVLYIDKVCEKPKEKE